MNYQIKEGHHFQVIVFDDFVVKIPKLKEKGLPNEERITKERLHFLKRIYDRLDIPEIIPVKFIEYGDVLFMIQEKIKGYIPGRNMQKDLIPKFEKFKEDVGKKTKSKGVHPKDISGENVEYYNGKFRIFDISGFKRRTAGGENYNADMKNGKLIPGRRNPQRRLNKLDIDFKNKRVLDIGCSSGGILLHLADKIKEGVGYDVNEKSIKNAKKYTKSLNYNNLKFYNQDIEDCKDFNYDIVFMLSIAKWVYKWEEIVKKLNKKTILIFEAHGNQKEQNKQINFLKSIYKVKEVLNDAEDGNPRTLLICKR